MRELGVLCRACFCTFYTIYIFFHFYPYPQKLKIVDSCDNDPCNVKIISYHT